MNGYLNWRTKTGWTFEVEHRTSRGHNFKLLIHIRIKEYMDALLQADILEDAFTGFREVADPKVQEALKVMEVLHSWRV